MCVCDLPLLCCLYCLLFWSFSSFFYIIFCILQKDVSCILIFIKFSRNILMWFSLKKMLRAIFIFVIFVHGVVFIVVCTFMILIVLLCAITFCCHLNLHESFCCSPKTVSAHAVKTLCEALLKPPWVYMPHQLITSNFQSLSIIYHFVYEK